MKYRYARKIVLNLSHRDYGEKYHSYYNEERQCWTCPSLANIDIVRRARKVYLRHQKRGKKKRL